MDSNYRSSSHDLPVNEQQRADWCTESSDSEMQPEHFVQEEFEQRNLPPNTTGSFSGTLPSSGLPTSRTPHLTIFPYTQPNSSYPYQPTSSPVTPQYGHMIPGQPDLYGNGMEYGSALERNGNFGHNSALPTYHQSLSSRIPANTIHYSPAFDHFSFPSHSPQFSPTQVSTTIPTNVSQCPPVTPVQPSASLYSRATNPSLSSCSPSPASPSSPSSSICPTNNSDQIIGYILSNAKKFACNDPSCSSMTFGRLADLRRHYNAQHVTGSEKKEYFCHLHDCARNVRGRKKSFGTRKDKRDEHMRNVHGIGRLNVSA